MAKIDKVISVKVEGVRRIKELEESLKKLRKEQRENKKQSEGDANRYSKTAKSIKEQSTELRGLRKQMAGVNETTKKGNKLQDSMFKGVVKGAAAFSILVTAFRRVNSALTTMISSFTEFEFTMAKVRAVSGATDDEFKKLESSAAELGRTTFFTASQVAQLQLNFSKLGFTTQEILDAQQATINLSVATGSDLARAATVAGSTIRGFGLDASEATRVVDVMALAFTSSALDIEKFQTSITKVAPIAAASGFTLEETTAIMAKLADTGIEASIAGTSLRNIFLQLQDPTSKLSRRFGNTAPNLETLLAGLRDMAEAGDDFGDTMGLVNIRQVAAFQTMVTGAEDVAALAKELENSSGAGQEMADIVGDTTQGAIFRLKSALEGLSIAIMNNFGKSIKDTLVRLADFITSISKNTKLLKNIGTTLKVIARLLLAYAIRAKFARFATALLNGGFLGLFKSIGRATTSLNIFKFSLKGLKTAIASTGLGLLVVLLGEVVAKLMFANEETEKQVSLQDQINSGISSEEVKIKKLELTLESLKKTRIEMGKIKGEGIIQDERRSKLKKQEEIDIKKINKALKLENQALIDIKDSTEDITDATNTLITSMKNRALAGVYTQLYENIIKDFVSADIIRSGVEDIINAGMLDYNGIVTDIVTGKGDIESILSSVIKDVEDDITVNAMSAVGGNRMARKNRLKELLEEQQITIDQFKDMIRDGALDTRLTNLKETVSKRMGGIDILDQLLSPTPTGGSGSSGDGPDGDDAITPLQTFLNKEMKLVEESRAALEHTEEEHNKKMMQARIKAFEDFLAQDIKNEDEIIRVQKQLASERLKLTKEELRIANLEADQDYEKEKNDLEERRAQDLISELEYKDLLLQIEADYLTKKKNINEAAMVDISDILTKQSKNERDAIELQKEALDTLFDSVMNVGDAIQSLAGDEEKLQGLRKVGIKITQAAAIAEQVLALKKQLVALSEAAENKEKIKGQAISLASIKTNLAESVSQGIKAGASFTAGVGKAFSANPLLGLAALASVFGIIASLRGLFQNPSLATGTSSSVNSGGGSGGSSGGLGSGSTLYSFANTGPTFADGGMVYGNSHTNGGEKFAVGGRVVELEGGEAVINKRSTAMFRSQLSAMNTAGGGTKFADGGIANSPSFAQTQFDVMGQSMMSSGGRVTVVEADITSTQNSVKTIESEASF